MTKVWRALRHCLETEDEKAAGTKRALKGIFFIYLILLLRVIVFKYPPELLSEIRRSWGKDVILEGLATANFTLFHTITMYIRYWGQLNSFENLFGNVVCFVPFGFLLPFLHPDSRYAWVLLINAFLFVSAIEVFQLVTAFGAFDVDDILLNCFGALLGHMLFRLCGIRT